MSDCGVCLADYTGEFDPASFYRAKIVVARKSHRCIECFDEIARGQEYEIVTANWEGRWTTLRTCKACRDIRDGLSCGGSVMHHTLWEDVTDIFPEMTMACVGKVPSAAGREKLLKEWRRWKFKEAE